MRSLLVAAAALLVAAPAVARPPSCPRSLRVSPVVQRGPGCLLAAAEMGAARWGIAAPAASVGREVRFTVDGAGFFDVSRALSRRGLAAPVYTGSATAAGQLAGAGVPTALAVRRASGRHVVLVVGWDPCRDAVELIDPSDGARAWRSTASVDAEAVDGQQLAIAPPAALATALTRVPALPPADLVAADRRFRAREHVLRARRHGAANRQVTRLLARAVGADPSWTAARDLLALACERAFDPDACPSPGSNITATIATGEPR